MMNYRHWNYHPRGINLWRDRRGESPANLHGMMKTPNQSKNPRLAAIDLDGTLLGPDLKISPENRRAVHRLAEAGFEVVLASGRHLNSMMPYVRQLPEVKWVVSSQGAEVGTADGSVRLGSNYLRISDIDGLLGQEIPRGFTAVYYAADDIFTVVPPNRDLVLYASISGHEPVLCEPSLIRQMPIQKVVWIGTPPAIEDLAGDPGLATPGLQRVRTEERMLEFMPLETTKASGLKILTAHLGLGSGNVVAFGDGENDVSMFEWAGLSFGMPHGWKNAIAKASHIAAPGAAHSALARAVDQLLSECGMDGQEMSLGRA